MNLTGPMYADGLPPRRNSDKETSPVLPTKYLTANMDALKQAMVSDSPQQLIRMVQTSEIGDPEEALIIMYVAVVIMNTPTVFDMMMEKHQRFKTKPVWHVLFSTPNIFQVLQSNTTMAERQKFDELVLKVALERDLLFISEIVLDHGVVTP